MRIRTLQPEDAAEYQALRLRGLEEAPTAFASGYEEEVGTPVAEIARRLQPKASGAIFGAFVKGTLAGLTGIERESMTKLSHKAYLWGMYVSPELRRSRLLISKMIQPVRVLAHAMSYTTATMGPPEKEVCHGAEQGAVPARPVDAGILRSVWFAGTV